MHWAWRIAKENYNASKVPPEKGVYIKWWHGNQERSKTFAQTMVNAYNIDWHQAPQPLNNNLYVEGKKRCYIFHG